MKQMLNTKTLKMNVEFFKNQDFEFIFINEIVEHCNVCKKAFQGLFYEINAEKFSEESLPFS
jgi:hypothetical protein